MRAMATMMMVGALALGCDAKEERAQTDTTDTTEETQQAKLEVTYISGHLGNYWDCPDQSVPLSSAGKADFAGEAGACREGTECPPSFMNCEHGALTIRVANVGTAAAEGLTVTDLEFMGLDSDTVLAVLEPLSVETTTTDPWENVLAPGSSVDIKILFKGPKTSDLGWDGGGRVHLIMTGSQATGELTTPELQVLPTVAT